MQRIALNAVIGTGDPRVRVVSRANPDFMTTRKAHTKAKTVFKLESRS